MFSGYYRPRWQEFFERINGALDAGTPFDRAPFASDMCRWEQAWSRRHEAYSTVARGDAVETAARMYARYRAELVTVR